MNNLNNQNAWYQKTWLVIILCIVFFPVGLYALWKNSKISQGWKIGISAFIGLAVIGSLGDEKSKNVSPSTSNISNEIQSSGNSNETQSSGNSNESEPFENWQYLENIDKMTSKTIKYAETTSKNKLDFEFPYNGGSTATLTIRKKNSETDIYVQISKGQFNSTYDGGQVRIRFDENQPKKYSFSPASDASSDIIFLNATKDIITKLKQSKSIIIEAEFYNEGLRQMEFDTEGFKWN